MFFALVALVMAVAPSSAQSSSPAAAPRLPPSALNLTIDASTRLLVVAPHPDDEALGAAGLIQRVRSRGGTVRILLMTSGDGFPEGVERARGISDPKPSDYRNYGMLREGETRAAMQLHYLVHYEQWPLSADAGVGALLDPPGDFPPSEGRWVSLALTADEAAAKKRALLQYTTQMQVIGRFTTTFGRDNELFIEGDPASPPECWCDGENVATEAVPAQYRRRPRRQ